MTPIFSECTFASMHAAGSPPLTPAVSRDIAAHALRRDAVVHLGVATGTVGAVAATLSLWAGWGLDYAAKALIGWGLGAWLVWRGLPGHPHARFGPANRVTLLRLAAVAMLAALVGEGVLRDDPLTRSMAWGVVWVATATALLDAVDGALARRTGLTSAFGARFDMETDAAYILVLCLLVIDAQQAGLWILAAGLMRYAFVAAARVWPWLNGPLVPSRRRQTVCVVQITALIVCLGPVISPALAHGLAAGSLALLTWSFAIDILALFRQRSTARET